MGDDYLFEALLRLGVARVSVRVEFQRQFLVGALESGRGGVLLQAENFEGVGDVQEIMTSAGRIGMKAPF